MKRLFPLILSLVGLASTLALADCVNGTHNGTGFVTPTSMTMTVTSIRLINVENQNLTLFSGSQEHEFKRSDPDFTGSAVDSVIVPQGRYIGVQACYLTARKVKLEGVVYDGANGTAFNDGATLFSQNSGDACAANAVGEANPGTAGTLTGYVVGTGTQNCSSSYFKSPVCVSAGGAGCASGDIVVNTDTTPPNVNLMMDLYNSVGVDADNGSLDNHIPVYPYPTIGNPGAAIHLTAGTGSNLYNISLIFGPDKELAYAASYGNGSLGGVCSGNGFVTATAAPDGAYLNAYGPTAVMDANTTSGLVQFATGNCTDSTCTSNGMMTLDNFKQETSNVVASTCVADSAATPAFLGYTYTAGAGVGGNTNFTIQRIVDPSNLFEICGDGKAGYMAGTDGSCSTSGGDGYP